VISIDSAPFKENQRKHKPMKNVALFENLTPDQKEKVMELRAELVNKESEINNRARDLRSEMNKCMLSKDPDMKKFEQLQKEAIKLRKERRVLKENYMNRIRKIIDQQSE
jgi:Spy/CpxP family protein refolding chaperone